MHFTEITLDKLRELKQLGGEDAVGFLLELLETYINDSAQRLANLEQCLAVEDLDGVARYSHALKSSSMLLGAVNFSALCQQAEQDSFEGRLTQVRILVEEITARYPQVIAELNFLLENDFAVL